MKDFASPFSGKPQLPALLTENLNLAFLNRLPTRHHTGRGRRRANSKPVAMNEELTSLYTSFNMWDGIRDLQKHRWEASDLQYFFLAGLSLFSLWIAPSAPGIKFMAILGTIWLTLMPATRQFFLPSSMIWVWLLYFFCSR